MPWRCGRPKEMLERPQVVLTLSSSRSRRSNAKTWRPASPSAPIGMTSGSTTTSCAGMPKSAQRSTIFLATAKRTSGSMEMPVSSFEIATTGTLYFLTSGRIASSFSSSPVTEFTSGRPFATFSAASMAADTELSIDSGRSTRLCTISNVWTSSAGLGLVRIDRGHAGVHVEHGRAARRLFQRVLDDGLEIASDHLRGQLFAAGRVDALADDAEGLVEADDDFAGRRGDDRAGHGALHKI